jgi:hypothetical protein
MKIRMEGQVKLFNWVDLKPGVEKGTRCARRALGISIDGVYKYKFRFPGTEAGGLMLGQKWESRNE